MKSYYERKPGLIFLYLSDLLPSSEADNQNTNKKQDQQLRIKLPCQEPLMGLSETESQSHLS